MQTGRTVITSIPTLIVPENPDCGGYTIIIQNMDNSKSIFLDGENVSSLTGFELKKGEMITIPVSPKEPLYGVAGAGNEVDICYLLTKR